MNSEEIYSSLRGVSQAIQNLSVRSQEDMTEPPRKREGDGGEEVRVKWLTILDPYIHPLFKDIWTAFQQTLSLCIRRVFGEYKAWTKPFPNRVSTGIDSEH